MESDKLDSRKMAILNAIIRNYLETGEPVGSRTISKFTDLSLSSATIRNEMADLEELGYLVQPHTSAGRIPSEAGYRFYVDQLIDRYNLTQNEISELKAVLRQRQNELDAIMQTAVTLAARLTNYTALSVKPRQTRISVSRFEIMRLDSTTAVLIMLIGGIVKTKYIRSDRPIPQDAAMLLAGALNARLTGLTADEITMPILMEMERMLGEYDFLVSPVVKTVCETISVFDGGELRFEGINRLLAYPDYYDMDRLREMLALFEKKETLLEVLSEEAKGDDRVQVFIGRENVVKVMDNSTLIFKTVTQNGKPVGAIGVIGPTRMDYRRVIATIEGGLDPFGSGGGGTRQSGSGNGDIRAPRDGGRRKRTGRGTRRGKGARTEGPPGRDPQAEKGTRGSEKVPRSGEGEDRGGRRPGSQARGGVRQLPQAHPERTVRDLRERRFRHPLGTAPDHRQSPVRREVFGRGRGKGGRRAEHDPVQAPGDPRKARHPRVRRGGGDL